MRILAVRTGRVGDTVMMTPALNAIIRCQSDTQFTILASRCEPFDTEFQWFYQLAELQHTARHYPQPASASRDIDVGQLYNYLPVDAALSQPKHCRQVRQ